MQKFRKKSNQYIKMQVFFLPRVRVMQVEVLGHHA